MPEPDEENNNTDKLIEQVESLLQEFWKSNDHDRPTQAAADENWQQQPDFDADLRTIVDAQSRFIGALNHKIRLLESALDTAIASLGDMRVTVFKLTQILELRGISQDVLLKRIERLEEEQQQADLNWFAPEREKKVIPIRKQEGGGGGK